MPWVDCSVHGEHGEGFLECCQHVRDRVHMVQHLASTIVEGLYSPLLLCDRCLKPYNLLPHDVRHLLWDPDTLPEILRVPMTGKCYMCMHEWFANTGQGSLDEAIQAAKPLPGLAISYFHRDADGTNAE